MNNINENTVVHRNTKRTIKAQVFLARVGLTPAWGIYEAGTLGYEENIIRDIVSKLIKWGSISDKQISFAKGLLEKIPQRAEREAIRAAEAEAAEDFPITDERVKVIGTVLSSKLQESQFGTNWKMLVKADAGWKVWCSIPGNQEIEKGTRITFFAKLQPSRDDAKFGFGSRPTKFEVEQAFEERPERVDDPNSIGEYDFAADDAAYDASRGH